MVVAVGHSVDLDERCFMAVSTAAAAKGGGCDALSGVYAACVTRRPYDAQPDRSTQ